jgi:hypothetical protein
MSCEAVGESGSLMGNCWREKASDASFRSWEFHTVHQRIAISVRRDKRASLGSTNNKPQTVPGLWTLEVNGINRATLDVYCKGAWHETELQEDELCQRRRDYLRSASCVGKQQLFSPLGTERAGIQSPLGLRFSPPGCGALARSRQPPPGQPLKNTARLNFEVRVHSSSQLERCKHHSVSIAARVNAR